MERYVSKQDFINVIGVWDGSDDGPVIDWLKDQGTGKYVYMIQVEEVESFIERKEIVEKTTLAMTEVDQTIEAPMIEQRKMLAVLGSGYYRHWSFDVGATVAVRDDGHLTELYNGQLENSYDKVTE